MKRSALLIVLSMVFFEWLDFSLYLYLAKSVFASEFFPISTNSLMLTFALFATAYLARPVGGWLFGREADLNGRRKPMVLSAALMGLATLGICILPNYAQWGVASTWALLMLRIGQGLAIGGEVNTSAMFLIEHYNDRPLIAGSFVAASGAFGMFMGGMLAAFIQFQNVSWMWRMVFALVGMASLWVCRLRKQLRESPEFKQLVSYNTNVWHSYWRGMVNIGTIGAFVSVTVYLCNVFWMSFAIDQRLWSNVQCTWVGSLAQLSSALLALPIARYSPPIWSKGLLQTSMLCSILTAPLLFYFTEKNMHVGVICALIGYVLTNGLLCSSLYYFLYLQLPPQYRCRGVSIIWALAASLGAIFLPIAQHAVSVKHMMWVPGSLVSLISLAAFIIIHRTDATPTIFSLKSIFNVAWMKARS